MKKVISPLITFGRRRTLLLLAVALSLSTSGAPASPQHVHTGSPPSSDGLAWSELQQSMQSMHEAMSSLKSSGNNDEDFVRLMLPHHQGALDMAKAELLHGKDPQMRRLAQEIITDQQSEIELMHLWLRQHEPQNSHLRSLKAKER
jgi:uncharacterized protein (DUF305 family)